MSTITPDRKASDGMRKYPMKWGYAGVFPGDFELWKGDELRNRLRFMVDHGFRSLHLGVETLRDPARREEVAAFVAEHDLEVVIGPHVGWLRLPRDEVRRASDRFLEDLERWGGLWRVPIVATGAGGVHRFQEAPDLAAMLDTLAEVLAPVARRCHELGRPLGIENHGDFYVSDLVELCRRVPHLGIFLDTGNCFLIGERPREACRLAAPLTIGTHFKDHRVHPDPRELKFVIEGAPLGEGHVGLREIYQDLVELNPAPERLVMQWEMVPPKGMNSWECLERSWRFVRSLEGQAAAGR